MKAEDKKRKLQMKWLKKHRAEYAGLYVALDGAELVAAGENRKDVFYQAKRKGKAETFVTYVYPSDYVGEITDEFISLDLEKARNIRKSIENQNQSDSAKLLRDDRKR